MSSFNKAILVGRLTRDPELRYTPTGRPVASFGLAVDRWGSKGQGGEKETDFFDIVAWAQLAETISKFATKGKMVLVEGRIQTRQYETKEGEKRKVFEIVANDIRLLGGGRREGFDGPAEGTYESRPMGSRPAGAPGGGDHGGPSDYNQGPPARRDYDSRPDMGGVEEDLPF